MAYHSENPSSADFFVSLISKQASFENHGAMQTVSVRMPATTLCTFEALAEYSGISRNKVIVSALDAAIEYLFKNLSEKESDQIEKICSVLLAKRVDDYSKDSQSLEISEV